MEATSYASVEFVSKYESNKERPTKWKIAQLSHRIKSKVQRMVLLKGNYGPIDIVLTICRFGIKGAEDFVHPVSGKTIDLEKEKATEEGKEQEIISDESLDLVNINVLEDLSAAISDLSGLPEQERKN